MAAAPAAQQYQLETDIHLVASDTAMGVTIAKAWSLTNLRGFWCNFCMKLQADPLLLDQEDSILLLQLFTHQYRTGAMSASGSPTKKCQVEQVLHSIGQTMASMGLPDPCLTPCSTKLEIFLPAMPTHRISKGVSSPHASKADFLYLCYNLWWPWPSLNIQHFIML